MTAPAAHKIDAIEGLRGLAALSVILFHWSFLFFGWVGVWVFFVISGFVITRSLIRLQQSPIPNRSMLATFYLRRAWRILPLYFAVVAVGAAILLAEAPDGSRIWELRNSFLALLTATVNFHRMSPGYEINLIFDHFWSLSVEEHFYIIMPIAFLCLRRVLVLKFLIAWLAVSPLIRLAISWVYTGDTSGELVYQFSASHFDAFSLGALIAVFERPIRERKFHAQWLLCAVMAMAAGWIVLSAHSLTAPGIARNFHDAFSINTWGSLRPVLTYLVLAYGSAAIIMCVIEGRNWLVAPLGLRFLVYSGNLSYGLYLIHTPLQYLFAKVWGPIHDLSLNDRLLPFVLYMGVLYAVAGLSYLYFELPLQRRAMRITSAVRHTAANG